MTTFILLALSLLLNHVKSANKAAPPPKLAFILKSKQVEAEKKRKNAHRTRKQITSNFSKEVNDMIQVGVPRETAEQIVKADIRAAQIEEANAEIAAATANIDLWWNKLDYLFIEYKKENEEDYKRDQLRSKVDTEEKRQDAKFIREITTELYLKKIDTEIEKLTKDGFMDREDAKQVVKDVYDYHKYIRKVEIEEAIAEIEAADAKLHLWSSTLEYYLTNHAIDL